MSLPLVLSVTATAFAQQLPVITVGAGCTLVQAINAANNANDVNGAGDAGTCQNAGKGANTITIPAGNPISFMNAGGGQSFLPSITSDITINGNGNTLNRPANTNGVSLVRFFYVGNQDANAKLTLNNLTLNGGNSFDQPGGAIYCRNGQVLINNSTFTNNTGYKGGALLVAGDGQTSCTATVSNSTFSGNTSVAQTLPGQAAPTNPPVAIGGAIDVLGGGVAVVSNSSFAGNSACKGGAISAEGGGTQLTLTNVTIAGNSATGTNCVSGGGLYVSAAGGASQVVLQNTIISGNTATSLGKELFRESNAVLLTVNDNNLIGHSGETSAEAILYAPPGASDITATSNGTKPTALTAIFRDVVNGVPTLSYNGGATDTLALARTTGQGTNLATYSNPAVDAADAQNAPSTDQRGSARAVGIGGSGDAADNPKPDIGAYELVNANFGPTGVQFEANGPLANKSINGTGYTAPAGTSFTSVGVVGFQVTNLANAGDSAIVRIVLPAGTNPTAYAKCDAGTKVCSTTNFPALTAADLKDPTKTQGYLINGDVITLKLTDGVTPGDSDAIANQITDPGAPVVGGGGAAGGGGGGGAFGALLLLPLSLMALLRRRRTRQPR